MFVNKENILGFISIRKIYFQCWQRSAFNAPKFGKKKICLKLNFLARNWMIFKHFSPLEFYQNVGRESLKNEKNKSIKIIDMLKIKNIRKGKSKTQTFLFMKILEILSIAFKIISHFIKFSHLIKLSDSDLWS